MNHDEFDGLARALFEESSEALMLLDPDTGRVLDANAAAQRLSGFTLRAMKGSPVSDLFRLSGGQWAITFPMPARTVHLPYAEWGGLLRTFQAARLPVDVTFVRLNVDPRPVALLRIREAPAPPVGAATGPAGARLRHLVGAVADCLWSAEVTAAGEGRFHYLSPVVEKIVGRPADAVGKDLRGWRDLIHADDRAVWDDALERRRAGKATQDEYRVVCPDGAVRWVRDDARAARAGSGRGVCLYGVFADVTSWRQAESSLRRLAHLVDWAEDAIFSQSADGLVVDWNRGAERLYGYTKEEMRSQPVLRLFAPDAVQSYTEAVRRLRQGEPAPPCRTTQVRKTGERIEVSLRLSPIGGDEGVSIIARDVNN